MDTVSYVLEGHLDVRCSCSDIIDVTRKWFSTCLNSSTDPEEGVISGLPMKFIGLVFSGFKYMGIGDFGLAMQYVREWCDIMTSDERITDQAFALLLVQDKTFKAISTFALDSMARKTVFTTTGGFTGCGAYSLLVGDSIVVIGGVTMPMAMRKVGDYHRLLCPVLIPPMMQSHVLASQLREPLLTFTFT